MEQTKYELSPEYVENNTYIRELLKNQYGEDYMKNKKVELVYDDKEFVWRLNVYDTNLVLK